MDTTNARTPADLDITDRLAAAAAVAALAPSIHNTQPWHWRVHDAVADLYADPRRQLNVLDPDRRLLSISCGAALHHAQVALAADGLAVQVELLPSLADPAHLARITVTGRSTVTDAAVALADAIHVRHTDRRPLVDKPLTGSDITTIRKICSGFAIGLHPLGRGDVLELAAATSRAQRDETDDIATLHELGAWVGERRPAYAGIPDANILGAPAQTTVPSRDFGRVGTVPVTEGHDKAAVYAILYGLDDEVDSWVRAGEALSATWLYATEHGIAVLPISAAVEEAFTRESLHRTLGGLGYAHLAIRLGIADPNQPATARTPRLPATETVTIVG